jgi:hypothetical protein
MRDLKDRSAIACALLVALTSLVLVSPAQAGNGRVEINQARALAGGVTPSDTPGFPVTIDTSGSYVLTGSLTVSDPNSDGIEIQADGVSLDLSGFEIVGPIDCTGLGSARTCPPGTGMGIAAVLRNRVTVRDGRVLGFAVGVVAGDRAQLRNLVAESNRIQGILAGSHAIVRECTAYQNNLGIQASLPSVIVRNTASSNQLDGISASGSIVGNAAYDNGRDGITVIFNGSVVLGNQAHQNEARGIKANGSVVTGNAANDNGHGGGGAGIKSMFGPVLGNTANDNAAWGLDSGVLGMESGYASNQFDGNSPESVAGGREIGMNVCGGDTSCPN